MTISHTIHRRAVRRGIDAASVTVSALLMLAAGPAGAQSSAPCTCEAIFDRLVTRIEADYLGFRMEIGERRRGEWAARVQRIRPQSVRADAVRCSWILRELLGIFADGHLGIIDMPVGDTATLSERLRTRPRHAVGSQGSWSETAVRHNLQARRTRGETIEPIEGIWSGPAYRVAVRLVAGTRDSAVGVLTAVSSGKWTPGLERASFARIDGVWRATVWDELAMPRTSRVVFSRGAMLRMAPLLWRRDDGAEAQAFLDSVEVRKPRVIYPDDSTAVISVVSFDPYFGPALATLIDREWNSLKNRQRVVIDVRGNEGGNSLLAAPLLPFLWQERPATASAAQAPQSVVLSSPASISYWQQAGWGPRDLVERLRSAPGALVSFDPAAGPFRIPGPARRPRADQQVYLLIDGATVSAAEQLVLWTRELGRATIIGANTAGSIDYQSAWFQRLACAEMGQMLMLPAIATSPFLPMDGHNALGIPPDRRWPTTGDWLSGLGVVR